MRRWNGWGDATANYPLPTSALAYLVERLGRQKPPNDATLDRVIAGVPQSRLPDHPLVNKDAESRVRHARGQSLPDWVALRSGQLAPFPDGVAHPLTPEDVRGLLQYAQRVGASVIPYGGGTSVVGHINPLPSDQPVLTINMSRMNALHSLDETSRLATFGAGVTGPELEAHLRARGYTLGHFPQSFDYSTLGGWIATRSSGQQSLLYGRIEDLFAGGALETPAGTLELPPFPASAAGPDLRHLVLGSEGRLGIITSAVVRISPLPQREVFKAVFFADFAHGLRAVRQMVQERLPLSMLRLSTAAETETTLRLAGHRRAAALLERLLAVRGVGQDKCMLMLGVTGGHKQVRRALRNALAVARHHGGVTVPGSYLDQQWRRQRFRTPYLRNTLWDAGYAVDTLETAVTWDRLPAALSAIEQALQTAAEEHNTPAHIFTHVSHVYWHGASLYTTLIFPLKAEPDATVALWTAFKNAASAAIVMSGGTISHQHGVGTDHAAYLAAEKGVLGLNALQGAVAQLDPSGMMNPGKLLLAG
ncbi:MAG: FAD-binding oxidoreductase [Aggregatilineales bacterium]